MPRKAFGAAFRRAEHRPPTWLNLAAAVLLCESLAAVFAPQHASAGPLPGAVALKPETQAAFERYVQLTDARNIRELQLGEPFLWVDSLPQEERRAAYVQLQRGEVVISRVQTQDNSRAIGCPGGRIHHWLGLVFIPGVTLGQTLRLVEDYDHHALYYRPYVRRSKIVSRRGDAFTVAARFWRKKIITVVLDTEFGVDYHVLDPARAFSRSQTTRVRQVEAYDTPEERDLPPDEGGGFMWSMVSYWRFFERDGGTYIQSESVTLSRNVPLALAWLIDPLIESVPRESLEFVLKATRDGVLHPRAPTPAGTP